MGLRRAAYQRTLQAPRWRRRATAAHWPHPPHNCYKRQQKQANWLQPTRLRGGHASDAETRLSRRQAGRVAIGVDKGSRGVTPAAARRCPQLRRLQAARPRRRQRPLLRVPETRHVPCPSNAFPWPGRGQRTLRVTNSRDAPADTLTERPATGRARRGAVRPQHLRSRRRFPAGRITEWDGS